MRVVLIVFVLLSIVMLAMLSIAPKGLSSYRGAVHVANGLPHEAMNKQYNLHHTE